MEITYSLDTEVSSSTDAHNVANAAHQEAEKILSMPLSDWKLESTVEGTGIYSFPEVTVNGVKKSGSLMQTRIKIGKNATKFFKFLTTEEGYCFLDPDADPSDFNKPVLGPYQWQSTGDQNSKIQVEYAQLDMKLPFVTKRDYVVMNAHDFSRRRWYCKSIQMPSKYPGCTSYYKVADGKGAVLSDGKIRMAYSVAYAVEDGETDETCYLRVVQWLDMQGKMGWANAGANKKYMGLFIERAHDKFPSEQADVATPLKGDELSPLAFIGSMCSRACGSEHPTKN
eukprot:gnl/MRDRNA2_/MRDRNA2_76611_c0_seq1.p1 gnl/MRDRNA2_/MRDRNA2_76611_c0~~gnl/MRDRNA2_/MRDRNA2_76611_c0_seq1.p1  ORF type:complete len:283 (+),score=41.89 gnl/MRDRNA2_/MRDRNA2_76611_c0_seq1:81-929(+)